MPKRNSTIYIPLCLMCGHTYYIARAWINRVRLPILLVVSWTGKTNISLSALALENLVSRDGFGSTVPRQPAHLHTQAESGAYLRNSSRVPQRCLFIYLKPPYADRSVPSLSGHTTAYQWRSLPRVYRHRASKPQGSSEWVSAALAGHHGPISMRLSFPHPLLVWSITASWISPSPVWGVLRRFRCVQIFL